MNTESGKFREIVSEYTDYVFAVTYRILGNVDDARDATQEAFLKLHASLGRFDRSRSLKNWICTIAINTARDCHRKRRHHRAAEEFDDERISDNGAGSGNVEDRILVDELLSVLDVNYRTVLVLFYIERKTVKEIAAMLDRPAVLIKVWLHRARKAVLKNLQESEQ